MDPAAPAFVHTLSLDFDFDRAAPGMPIAAAVALVRSDWASLQAAPDPEAAQSSRGFKALRVDKPFWTRQLQRTARDCGWCIFHSQGDSGLHKFHDAAIKGMPWEKEGYHLSRLLDFSFSGIGDWRA